MINNIPCNGKLHKISLNNNLFSDLNIYHWHEVSSNALWKEGERLSSIGFNRQPSMNGFKKEIEEIYEEKRKQINPNFPSRYSCLFLALESNYAAWKNNFLILSQLVKVRLIKGKAVVLDEDLFNRSTGNPMNLIDRIDYCEKYWNGEVSPTPVLTILFEGDFEIIESISSN